MAAQPDELQLDGPSHTALLVQDSKEQRPLTTSRYEYTREELLMLRPIKDVAPDRKKCTATVANEEKPEEKLMASEKGLVELKLAEPKQKLRELKATVHDESREEAKPEQSNDASQAEPPAGDPENDIPGGLAEKKKKKKKKSSGKIKKERVTGFEEFYADPPVTPDEYYEELHDIYHYSRSFVERMQLCIQRYRARRKLDEKRANYFNQYLTLGGVETGMKAFGGGLDKDDMENYTAKQIEQIRATDHIRGGGGNLKFYDPSNPAHWVVDFEGVVKGFLSHRAPEIFGLEAKDIKEYCGVIRNFLNYVLTHSVCPEYLNEVIAARAICDLAEKELGLVRDIVTLFPGDFNIAASTLFGGYYEGLYIGCSPWNPHIVEDPHNSPDAQRKRKVDGIRLAEAERIFKLAIITSGKPHHIDAIKVGNIRMVKEGHRSLEVVDIVMPTQRLRDFYATVKDADGHSGKMMPIGLLKVKHWDNPAELEEDMSDDGQEERTATIAGQEGLIEEFRVEQNILEKCFIGMKFSAIVRELNVPGIKYFDTITGIYCSFYTFLPAERLDGWKEPVRNPRPGPTVDDVNNDDMQNDVDFEEPVAEDPIVDVPVGEENLD